MRRKSRYFLWILAAIALPVVGYGVMHLLIYAFPMSETATISQVAYTVIMIALGLLIPFFMLKAIFAAAQTRDRHEKSLELKDLPKDKDQLVSGH